MSSITMSSITNFYRSSDDGLGDDLWVDSMTSSSDYGVETVVVVSSVMDGSKSTIGFGYGVGTFDDVAITFFFLGFVVTGMSISNSVVEFVFWVCLKQNKTLVIVLWRHLRFSVQVINLFSKSLKLNTYKSMKSEFFYKLFSFNFWSPNMKGV